MSETTMPVANQQQQPGSRWNHNSRRPRQDDSTQKSGAKTQNHQDWRKNNKTKNHRKCQLTRNDFQSFLQNSPAKKFRVHKPACDCPQAKNAIDSLQQYGESDGLIEAIKTSGFVVLSDTKAAGSLFHGGGASVTSESYQRDPLGCEAKLRDLIFSRPTGNIKINVASCMLKHIPNGFVCVTSEEEALVNKARDLARATRASRLKQGWVLHRDHAHYVCTVQKDLLLQGNKPSADVRESLTNSLRNQGVPIERKDAIQFGHHLRTFLKLLKGKEEYAYMLVMLYKDPFSFEINLPGGKRHLGEASLEAAVREVFEETSLRMDGTWLVGEGRPLLGKGSGEWCNAFYIAQPPISTKGHNVDELAKDEFWNKTGLGETS